MSIINPSVCSVDIQSSTEALNTEHPFFIQYICKTGCQLVCSLTMITHLKQVIVLIKKRHLNSIFHMIILSSRVLATHSTYSVAIHTRTAAEGCPGIRGCTPNPSPNEPQTFSTCSSWSPPACPKQFPHCMSFSPSTPTCHIRPESQL